VTVATLTEQTAPRPLSSVERAAIVAAARHRMSIVKRESYEDSFNRVLAAFFAPEMVS
jgi:hypothetical protein